MMTSIDTIGEKEKEIASTWFFSLRDRICSEFEKLEHDQTVGPFKNLQPGKFERKETLRKGKEGEDGVAQSYFEYLRIPYTHSGVISSYNSMDKVISKKILCV